VNLVFMVIETEFVSDPLPPSAAVPLKKGDTKIVSKINEDYSPPREGESRRRRQGVAHTDFLCKAPHQRNRSRILCQL